MKDNRNLRKVNIVTSVSATPSQYIGQLTPTNLVEMKDRFLKHGTVPNFKYKSGSSEHRENIVNKIEIDFQYFEEAKRILDTVKSVFGTSESYLYETFGKRTNHVEASSVVAHYLSDNNLDGVLKILWSEDLVCSGQLHWRGPCIRFNKPESRVFTLMLKNSLDNPYLTEHGIKCLMDHEIGTHFFRAWNDGIQPWYSDRKRFGLHSMSSRQSQTSEEGLACIHTVLQAKNKYLFLPALAYYTACMSASMTFKQLYKHLETYVSNKEHRWKLVMRVKRGLSDANSRGGYGQDQCYFRGAVEILRNIDNIDFSIFISGKICHNEVSRVKRLARTDCIKLPAFMKNMDAYIRQIKHIANLNELGNYQITEVHKKKSCASNGNRPKTDSDARVDRSSVLRPVKSEANTPKSTMASSPTQSRRFSHTSTIPYSRKSLDHSFNRLANTPPNLVWRKGNKKHKSQRKSKKLLNRRKTSSTNMLLYDYRQNEDVDSSDSEDSDEN